MRDPASPAEGGIFATHALQMLAHHLAVLPTAGKKPLIKGWHHWRWLPSVKTVSQMAQQFPTANVAILPGLSKICVADVDAADQVAEVEKLLGTTPLHVKSNRGVHLYYLHVEGYRDLPGNLKRIGLNVDLKVGNSIVIAPPSQHESGAIYRHDKCTWEALRDLPPPNLQQLRRLLTGEASAQHGSERHEEGQRGIGLNKILCRHAAYAETFDELLDVARTTNANFLPPLSDAEVVKRTRQAWQDARDGKIQPWAGHEATARIRKSEIKLLNSMGRNGADAVVLLMVLRAEHGARYSRGETFSIVAEAMQEKQTIPGWHWKRYVAARDLLLKAGKLKRVMDRQKTRTGWLPAKYTFGAGS
jgi:hypothetical protein